MDMEAAEAVLQAADVVASTCVGIGDARVVGRQFDVCVVDEASQVTEPDSLVAILQVSYAHLWHVVYQLQPSTILSQTYSQVQPGMHH